jgi:ABC-type nitrate/sulfonate/bicarbonate transport system ATPase subunit
MVNPVVPSSLAISGRVAVDRVRREFKDGLNSSVLALDQVSLEIHPGELVSLIGPSGCGKSTLLRLIAGLDTPDAGQIRLDGEPITGTSYLRGLVFQDPTLYPWLTVRHNVALGPKARGLENVTAEIAEYINLVGLEGFENSYPHQLSGGMAQRVALARALINHPKVLLLDEPLGALDAFTRMRMQDEILRIWENRRTTMIFVTHDIDEAIYLSDRIVIMTPRPGRIQQTIAVAIGRPRVRNHPDFFRIRSNVLELLDFAKEYPLNYYL